jgi:hypothetical protein
MEPLSTAALSADKKILILKERRNPLANDEKIEK